MAEASEGAASAAEGDESRPLRVALLGNPNTGKTTLFNRICGLRSKTANFPGSTVESHVGSALDGATPLELIDLPGIYGLRLELPESKLCLDCLEGRVTGCDPDAVLLVLDATNLARGLALGASVLRRGRQCVAAVTMTDVASRGGLSLDMKRLSARLGCPAVAASGRSGEGIGQLLHALAESAREFRLGQQSAGGESLQRTSLAAARSAAGVPSSEPGSRESADWAAGVLAEVAGSSSAANDAHDLMTDRLDHAFTHPLLGLVTFAAVMTALFGTIFWLAGFPMDAIDALFTSLGGLVERIIPPGLIQELLRDGIVGGIAGTVVFIPQIALLFFLLSLLEDSGYLARAAFAVDRNMRRVGLPGQAFIPLLSSHACALPGIMSARLIPDRRDRLATILVAPFLSCSARVPVYVLLTSLLFQGRPFMAGAAFVGCYLLGATAAFASAFIARKTILRGASRPMMLELPPYRIPSIRSALIAAGDRSLMFLRSAGGVILAICVLMWWLQAFPRASESPETPVAANAAETLPAPTEAEAARAQRSASFAGMLGRTAEPIFAPLGFDRQVTVSVLASFLAREVFVGSMKVLVAAGENDAEMDEGTVAAMREAKRDDGSPVFTTATSASLLVFYVLAMQCLPTLAVTRRETGSWKWALLQLGWMTAIAYCAAFVTHQLVVAAVGAP